MSVTVSRLEEILKEKKEELAKLHVKSLFVFGSVAHGKAKENSDIDFLVEFDQPVGMFDFLELKYSIIFSPFSYYGLVPIAFASF